MRICLVYDCLFPYTVGGAERWYRNLAERLAAEGHEVTYLTLRQWERGAEPQIEGVRVVAVGPRMALYTADGRRRIAPPLVFGWGVLWHLLRRGRRYEVVHTCSFPYFSLLAAAAARRWAATDWSSTGTRCGAASTGASTSAASAGRWATRCSCSARACPSGRSASRGCTRGACAARACAASRRCSRGSTRARWTPRRHGRRSRVVVFAGRLIPEKRAPLAVAAFALAARRVEGLRGEFYGDGPEREALQRAIVEHGVQGDRERPGLRGGRRCSTRRSRGRSACSRPRGARATGWWWWRPPRTRPRAWWSPARTTPRWSWCEEGVNGFVAASAEPEAVAEAIVRVHEAGWALRESTARWFAENAQRLSLESSLRTVLGSYEQGQDPI